MEFLGSQCQCVDIKSLTVSMCIWNILPSFMLIIPLGIPPLTGIQWLVIYDLYCSHKPYGTSEPPFSSTKGYLPSIFSVRKLLSIQQFNNSHLINLLTTILPNVTSSAPRSAPSHTRPRYVQPGLSLSRPLARRTCPVLFRFLHSYKPPWPIKDISHAINRCR